MKIIPISKEDKDFFQKCYKNHNVVGLMEEETITRVILKAKNRWGNWTPHGTARDCGNYYIIAKYSTYLKVDKKTLQILDDDADDK